MKYQVREQHTDYSSVSIPEFISSFSFQERKKAIWGWKAIFISLINFVNCCSCWGMNYLQVLPLPNMLLLGLKIACARFSGSLDARSVSWADRTQNWMGLCPSPTDISETTTRSSAAASRALSVKQKSRRPGSVLLVMLLLYCHHGIYLLLDLLICKIYNADIDLEICWEFTAWSLLYPNQRETPIYQFWVLV